MQLIEVNLCNHACCAVPYPLLSLMTLMLLLWLHSLLPIVLPMPLMPHLPLPSLRLKRWKDTLYLLFQMKNGHISNLEGQIIWPLRYQVCPYCYQETCCSWEHYGSQSPPAQHASGPQWAGAQPPGPLTCPRWTIYAKGIAEPDIQLSLLGKNQDMTLEKVFQFV